MEFKKSKDDNKKQFNQNISNGGLVSQKLMDTPLMQQKLKKHQAIFGDSVTQLELFHWKNPSIKGIDSGFGEAKDIAEKIDKGTEKGYKEINNAIKNISEIEDWKDFKNQFSEIKNIPNNNIDNFTNKMNDWILGEQKHPPSKEAGYLIEAYATLEAKNIGSVSTQFQLGASRPDFKISTGKIYDDAKGITYNADGLVDATSQKEASDGHVLGKVTRNVNLKDKDNKEIVKNYPHLWDSYYSPIKWNENTKLDLKIEFDELMKERQKQKDKEAEQAKNRKESLRSNNIKGKEKEREEERKGKQGKISNTKLIKENDKHKRGKHIKKNTSERDPKKNIYNNDSSDEE